MIASLKSKFPFPGKHVLESLRGVYSEPYAIDFSDAADTQSWSSSSDSHPSTSSSSVSSTTSDAFSTQFQPTCPSDNFNPYSGQSFISSHDGYNPYSIGQSSTSNHFAPSNPTPVTHPTQTYAPLPLPPTFPYPFSRLPPPYAPHPPYALPPPSSSVHPFSDSPLPLSQEPRPKHRSTRKSRSKRSHSDRDHDAKRGTISTLYNIDEFIVQKVIRLEYTPIFDLFPPSAYETDRGFFLSEEGELSSKRRKVLPPFPVDYSTWSEAADVLFQIRDDYYPDLRVSNRQYKDFIRIRFKEWNPIAVWRWDSLWRQEAARLLLPLFPLTMEFWSIHFPTISRIGSGTLKGNKGCFLCPSEYHTASVCPLRNQMYFPDSVSSLLSSRSSRSFASDRPARQSFSHGRGSPPVLFKSSSKSKKPTSTSTHSSTGLCDFFNIPRGCKKIKCTYKHVCARCKSSSHGSPSCPK